MRRLALRRSVHAPILAVALVGCVTPESAGTTEAAEAADESGESGESSGVTDESTSDDWADSLEEGEATDTGDPPPPGPEVVDYETCIVDPGRPNATLAGDTPEGPFSGEYAWFGWLTCDGDAISPTLVIGESPDDLAAAIEAIGDAEAGAVPVPSLEWYLLGNCDHSNGWVGKGGGAVQMRHADGDTPGYAFFSLFENYKLLEPVDPEDPPTMHGILSMGEPGWSIDGEFTAVYCGALSYPLPDCGDLDGETGP